MRMLKGRIRRTTQLAETDNCSARRCIRFTRLFGFLFILILAVYTGWSESSPGAPAGGSPDKPSTPEADAALFSLSLTPEASIPLGVDADYFTIGGGASLAARYTLPFLRPLSLGVEISYRLQPIKTTTDTLSILSGGALVRLGFEPIPWLGLGLLGEAGYFYGFCSDRSLPAGYNPYVGGGAEIGFRLFDGFWLGISGFYRSYIGLYGGPSAALTTAYTFGGAPAGGKQTPVRKPLPAAPKPLEQPSPAPAKTGGGPLAVEKVEFVPVFPVFYKYYDDHPIGKVTLTNKGNSPIQNIRVSLLIRQYMDAAKDSATLDTLQPGESRTVDLFALFTTNVLGISEATKSTASVTAKYAVADQSLSSEYSESVRINDRNALTWDDNRKACAFVTSKDPTVMKFAKNIVSLTKDKGGRAVNRNILAAIAMHESLRLYGLSYQVDPNSSYKENVANMLAVDYLQYPKQTLEYKAGDCDDLSILYASLLESLGVETAFITIPGHIYMAFSLGVPPDTARSQFSQPDDLILTENGAWLPIEVTERQGDFLKAWKSGAKEWRENEARKAARLFPTHEAWKLYEPVGISGEPAPISLPDADKITAAYLTEVVKYIDQEIYPQVVKLQAEISSKQGKPEPVNKLGVLYARYGLDDRAEAEFKEALKAGKYVPALLNIGNLYYLKGDMERALDYYSQAQRQAPDNPKVLLAIARANHATENYGTAKAVYDRLKRIDSVLAAQFAYLDFRGEEASRAADVAQVKGVVIWEQ